MALYLSESGLGGTSSGSGSMYSYFNTSNRFNFHALRRDEDGMLVYTKANTSDSDTIDVFNIDGTAQIDFMDAWNNVVEVGAVKSVSLVSGGIPVDSDANVTYTVTGLVGNGDGDGEPNQKPGEGLNLQITRDSSGLVSDIQIHSGGASFSPNETVTVASSKINDVTDLTIRVTEVVKSFSNNQNIDKYQQYKFEARKITYFIDDEGYFVARFGTYDYNAGPK
tara:strand:- start:564 stop:1232 length:669 start_codon:yes stop_codon:yes gene_type:complete